MGAREQRLICPNPECLNRRRTGHAAEFQAGVTHCSDCGAPLATEEAPPAAPAASSSTPRPWGRLLITLGVVAGLFARGRVPLPRVDRVALVSILSTAVASALGLALIVLCVVMWAG